MNNNLYPDGNVTETPLIQTIFCHVTKACNLNCSYCYFSARKPLPDELSTDHYWRLWSDIVAIRPKKVVLTGGEPLLRKDILELIYGFRNADPEHKILLCLNSNGHAVSLNIAEQLIDLVDEVRISIGPC